jgi:hypothetical protein
MDLSRRDAVKYGALSVLGAVSLGSEAQDRYEVSEQITKRLVSDREYALQQIEELQNSYQAALQGESGVTDFAELMYLFLGNPNHFEDYSREGFIPDTEDLLRTQTSEEAFKNYAENGVEEIPFTSTQASLLLDQELDLDLVYLDQGREADELLSDGLQTVEAEVGNVLPGEYEFSVDSRVVEPDAEVEEALKSISEEKEQGVQEFNEVFDYNQDSTLPVYVIDPREFDRLSSVADLDFSEFWGGFGTPEGSVVAMPSTLLQISEEQFYSTLVHEVGHSAFELPHSSVRDDVMTYNQKNDHPTGFTTSELLKKGIYFRQEPASIPHEEAENAFLSNLNAYLTDMVDAFDLDVGKFEEISYQRRNGLDVAQYQDYDGTGVGMEISVNGLIQDIESQS